MRRKRGGFTLLEVVIALSLWMILSAGVFFVWQHAVNSGADMLERQYAFENARVTMDALLVNLQMARSVTIRTDATPDGEVLRTLYAWQINPTGHWQEYEIHFMAHYEVVTIGQRSRANTFATTIAHVRIEYLGDRFRVTVKTTCDEPVKLTGSVCARGKYVELR